MRLLVIGGSDAGIAAALRARELEHTAQTMDAAQRVAVTSRHGERELGYGRLVLATGAVPARPPIDGLDLDGLHVLHTMADTFALQHALAAGARSAVIVGGGYIGLEMAEAFTTRGLAVTLVEQAPAVTVGSEVAKRIDIPATALFRAMTVEGLSDLDLSYMPPFRSPWDAIQMAAPTWTRQTRSRKRASSRP